MEKPIEERSIPGVTAKYLMWFFGGVISVIVTVMGTHYSTMAKIEQNATKWETLATEIKALRDDQKTMQVTIQTIQLQIATMQAQNAIKNQGR
ncbi:MAG TPA: hypothetical protein VF622_17945 [Segetibacter sp.]|jgi:outer membrane murein-binding lipoprotein Lpp